MAKLPFDANKVAPQQPMEPVPTGWYPVVIDKSEIIPTKDTKGTLLKFEYVVASGDFKGRRIFDRLNIKNPSAQAQQIGLAQLSSICHAIGVLQVKDTVELHGKPFMVRAVYRDADKDYDASNDVKGYKPMEGASPAAAAPGATSGGPAWLKSKAAETEAAPEPTPEETTVEETPAAENLDAVGFYVYVEGETIEKTGAELKEMYEAGMPDDTPICLDTASDKGWKVRADFPDLAPAPEPTAPATPPPPAGKKKPAAPAAPAAAAKPTPPWLKGKK